MSDAITHMQRISVELQELTAGYERVALDAATAEANYRERKAKRMLTAIVAGRASAARAEIIANADDDVAAACLDYKTSEAVARAHHQRMMTLRVEFEGWRAQLQRETTADRIHSQVAP